MYIDFWNFRSCGDATEEVDQPARLLPWASASHWNPALALALALALDTSRFKIVFGFAFSHSRKLVRWAFTSIS
jgi:hypothetical protein